MKDFTLGGAAVLSGLPAALRAGGAASPVLQAPLSGESLPDYVVRLQGKFDPGFYAQVLGVANPYKEGDEIIGVAAADEASRAHARQLLTHTLLADIDRLAPHQDRLFQTINANRPPPSAGQPETLGALRDFLLAGTEAEIKSLMPALSSDVIGCVVKLLSNEELIAIGAKVFNPLPGSRIGARGYLGARVQPNSPTDDPEDIQWQVFDAFAYGVGDVLLGTNPVSSTVESVTRVELCLRDILTAFELTDALPHCVLSHIDVQAEVERRSPGATALWFQSIAGTESANGTFDVTIEGMQAHAAARTGRYGLYFETGQGADFTNGHGHGFDMVLHESRKYGFARSLAKIVGEVSTLPDGQAWVHLNDVAGFIGPEVFRSREQLVRCCLEDIVMGKLHGLCIGLDVCSTLHMDVSLDDLDWCLEQIAPANPAYLMALPTKIDPMLGYLTTGYQDHLRLRDRFGYRINPPMQAFFEGLGVLDGEGRPGPSFGQPRQVYLRYRRLKGDTRSDAAILAEGQAAMDRVRARGLFLAEGHGEQHFDLEPELRIEVDRIYAEGKRSIWAELDPAFVATIPDRFDITTQSEDREDYILHPESGERLALSSRRGLQALRLEQGPDYDVQLVISDGLNAHSIMEPGHLRPFLEELRQGLEMAGYQTAPDHLLIRAGRVRTGYRIGETLFGDAKGARTLLHVIGERPGTGHDTFSVYITRAEGHVWGEKDRIDHNITRVVSGIARTALAPRLGAQAVLDLLGPAA